MSNWSKKYNEYLQSYQWQDKRLRVLERDNYLCQSCLEQDATQVHHLTYKHVGNEPLFDLISVCDECHKSITFMDRLKKNDSSIIFWCGNKSDLNKSYDDILEI